MHRLHALRQIDKILYTFVILSQEKLMTKLIHPKHVAQLRATIYLAGLDAATQLILSQFCQFVIKE